MLAAEARFCGARVAAACEFDASAGEWLDAIRPGDRVTLTGRYEGAVDRPDGSAFAVFRGCVLREFVVG